MIPKAIGVIRIRFSKGMWLMLLAAMAFAIMGILSKLLSSSFSAMEIVFYRNFIGLVVLGGSFWHRPMANREGKRLNLLIFRGISGTLALLLFFYNVAHISLGESVLFYQAAPLFITLISWWFMGEKVNSKIIIALLIGFVGVLLILRPTGQANWIYKIVGVACALLVALAYISVKELKQYYETRTIVLAFVATGVLLPLVCGLYFYIFPTINASFLTFRFLLPELHYWPLLLLLGLCSLGGQVWLTQAYGLEKASIVGTIGYSNVFFSVFLGFMAGDMLPTWGVWCGMLLIIIAGVSISLEKKV